MENSAGATVAAKLNAVRDEFWPDESPRRGARTAEEPSHRRLAAAGWGSNHPLMLYLRRPGRLVFLRVVEGEEHVDDLWLLLQEAEFLKPEGLDC